MLACAITVKVHIRRKNMARPLVKLNENKRDKSRCLNHWFRVGFTHLICKVSFTLENLSGRIQND